MFKFKQKIWNYGVAIALVVIATLLMLALDPYIQLTQASFLLFFGAVTISAWYGGRDPGLLATFFSTLCAKYFFLEPVLSLNLTVASGARMGLFVFQGCLISVLVGSLRIAQQQSRQNLEQLQQTEARLRRLVDSNIIGVISCDIYGTIHEANNEFLRMTGFSQEDVLAGRVRWDQMTPPDLRDRDVPAIEELLTKGKNTAYEKAFIGKNGQRIPVIVGAALLHSHSESLISFVLDLSDRKQAEQRLAVQYAVAKVLAEASTLADVMPLVLQSLCEGLGWQLGFLWRVDPQANMMRYLSSWSVPEMNVADLMRTNQEITFTSGVGLPGRIWKSGQPAWISNLAQDPNFPRAAIACNLRLHSVFGFPVSLGQEILGVIECFSNRYQEPDDDLLHLMSALGSQIGQFMERQQAEEELQASQALFQSFMNYSPVNAFIKDESGHYLYVNPQVEHSFHRPLAEWLGKTDFDFFAAEVAQPIRDNDVAVLRTGQAMQIAETNPLEDGEHHFLSFKFPIKDAAGQQLLAGMAVDITEQRQAQAELARSLASEQAARAEAEAANRIKDEFLAVLSHELRSPLNPILGWSHLMRTGKLDENKTAQALSVIERNAKLQSELIEDLLDVSRILRGKLSLNIVTVDLATTVVSAMETVRLAAQAKSIQIHHTLDANIPQISGDPARLQQVVWNLLSNAVKFTPEGGRVDVRLEQDSTHAQITVSDTGKGIKADFLPHIFDYFRQADATTTRKFGGLGLGLAIVRHLVELHGGMIQAESPGEGQGAIFTVKLPLPSNPNQERQNQQSSELSVDLSSVQVLLVDDDIDTREFVAFLLEQAGAVVTAAANATEALAILRRSQPDVLVSDIGMPDMDGYMLIRQVRALPPEQGGQIPALALTAYAGDFNQQQALQAGFQKHISKPLEPEILLQAIANLIKYQKL
ncbi:MAG TPA: PAS domain S-box protein [Trichormus sp. M33_DOE_039]|nr:PAS domain S-box protein [Trichormus sp. M33_DOE_039]